MSQRVGWRGRTWRDIFLLMSPSARKILEQVESWPEEDQEELAEYAREIEARRSGVYRLSEDESAALAQSAEDVRAGRFASDEQIAAIFTKARSAGA